MTVEIVSHHIGYNERYASPMCVRHEHRTPVYYGPSIPITYNLFILLVGKVPTRDLHRFPSICNHITPILI